MKRLFQTGTREEALDILVLFIRIAIAVFMIQHGLPKLSKLLAGGEIRFGDPIGLGPTFSLILVVFAEFFCSILLGIGLGTRLATLPLMVTMFVAAFVLFALSFIPGFPTYVFLSLAIALGVCGFVLQRKKVREAEAELERQPAAVPLQRQDQQSAAEEPAGEEAPKALPPHGIVVHVAPDLHQMILPESFAAEVEKERAALIEDLGVTPPPINLSKNDNLEDSRFTINLQDVPVSEGRIPADGLLLKGDPVDLGLADVPYERSVPLIDRSDSIWVKNSYQSTLEEALIGFLTPAEVLGRCLGQMLLRYSPQFVGIQETRAILSRAEAEFGDLIKETQNVVPNQKIAEIMRRLVEENVPIRNVRLILEALVEYAPKEKDVVLLGEYVRMALGRQICFRVADRNRVIAAYVLERAVEESLRSAIRPTAAGTFLSIPEATARPIINQFRRILGATKPDIKPTVLATMDVRRHLRNLLVRNGIELPVLSYQELTPEFSVQPLATIVSEVSAPSRGRPASGSTDRPTGQSKRRDQQVHFRRNRTQGKRIQAAGECPGSGGSRGYQSVQQEFQKQRGRPERRGVDGKQGPVRPR